MLFAETMDFLIGGTAAMCAGFFSNPFDVIKTRQQLQGELQKKTVEKLVYSSQWQAIKAIIRAEGMVGLQKGLGSALAFQFILNSTRLGLYETVDQLNWTRMGSEESHSTVLCVFWGAAAGVAGSTLGCPLYMVKTQIQAQSHGKFAVGFQHHHSGTVNALITTYRAQGLNGLWRGFEGMAPRTAVGSATQMTTYTMCKDFFNNYEVEQASPVRRIIPLMHFSLTDFQTVDVSNAVGVQHDKRLLSVRRDDSVRCRRHSTIQPR